MTAAPALALALALAGPAQAGEAVRQQEQTDCRDGEIATWGDGRDRPAAGGAVAIAYQPGGAPPGLPEALVVGALQRAALAWSSCGVPVTVIDEAAAGLYKASLVRVLWDDAGARGNFGLANLGQRSLSLGPSAFKLLAERNPRHPAHQTLQMVLSHEIGHFMGLMAHSSRCVDVMSYYDNGRGQVCSTRDGASFKSVPEYRALLPTACDIARCRAVNAAGR